MGRDLWKKIRESIISVLPITLIVVILSFTPLFNLTGIEIGVFIASSILLIIGIALFNLGADMAMSIMGEQAGSALMRTRKIWIIGLALFLMGLLITIAEPDLSVLAGQVSNFMNEWVLKLSIGVGVGLFLLLAVIKIIFKKDLSMILIFFYMMMFSITALVIQKGVGNFIALAYDSGGVTTGPITVPFIMALGLGIASTVGGRGSKENSFGLVSLCSIGPIIAVLILGLTINPSKLSADNMFDLNKYKMAEDMVGVLQKFGMATLETMRDVSIALGLVVAFFLIINFIFIKLPKKKLIQIAIGILYTFVGLIIFLTAATVGFLSIGFTMGTQLANNSVATIIFGFVIGLVVVLAEPAVHVLTKQVEEVTMGGVKKKSMLIALCLGVGVSILLSMIRIIFNFSILYYLVPGYLLSLGLSFFVPKVYTAIAFDSGGVASGPLTSSFILPFAIGVCSVVSPDNMLENAFGIVAMVAMTPLITIQLLGFRSVMANVIRTRNRMKRITSSDDEQIINFM